MTGTGQQCDTEDGVLSDEVELQTGTKQKGLRWNQLGPVKNGNRTTCLNFITEGEEGGGELES